MDYRTDEGSWALGCVVLTLFAVLIIFFCAPAHSQEAPRQPCGPSADIHATLQKQYGETVTAGGIIGSEYLELLTNKRTGTFTILMRRLDGTACIVAGGEGFALADPAKMKGSGL